MLCGTSAFGVDWGSLSCEQSPSTEFKVQRKHRYTGASLYLSDSRNKFLAASTDRLFLFSYQSSMGAQESRDAPGESDTAVQDYYSILEVSETATQDEIKASRYFSVCFFRTCWILTFEYNQVRKLFVGLLSFIIPIKMLKTRRPQRRCSPIYNRHMRYVGNPPFP